ncbi:MAG: hypothetical protein COB14_00095 [Alphaproteobacteria bacterium]|nr:MAG: hypothetical protein COB14_00095 [Alphaproteobacteria bacterium]
MAKNDKQMALLKSKLHMPLIVRDLLITNQSPNASTHYALHEIMGDFQPDSALLCAAFVMEEISNFESIISPDLTFLQMECTRIIERYSTRNDLAEKNHELWTETQSEMMLIISEDIEEFLEITSLCQLSFEITNPKIAIILNIITAQLQSHLMIVDEVVSLQETLKSNMKTIPAITGYMADNVIMFPG